MKLTYVSDPRPPSRFPNGYWHARTDDDGNDGIGPTPVDALAALVAQMEQDR